MKKTFGNFLMLLAVFFVVAAIADKVFGQEKPTEKTSVGDRYYTGIGVSIAMIDPDTPTFYANRIQYNNDHSQFTNKVVVLDVLRKGTAEAAGIRAGDIIAEINGHNTLYLSLAETMSQIKDGPEGSTIHVKIARPDVNGNITSEFETDVMRGKIDRLMPILNHAVSGGVTGKTPEGKYRLTFESKVTEDIKSGNFVYWYRVKNKGQVGTLSRWGLVERAMRGPKMDFTPALFETLIIALKPGEEKEFRLVSPELPTYYNGSVAWTQVFLKTPGLINFRPFSTNTGFYTTHAHLVTFGGDSRISGFIPERWIAPNENFEEK